MLKKYKIAVLALVSFVLCVSVATAKDQWSGNVNVFGGVKNLDKEWWYPVEEQKEVGVEIDFRKKNWPVNIAIDILQSWTEETVTAFNPALGRPIDTKYTGNTTEFNIGIRKIFDEFPSVRPFIGGGLSYIRAEFEGSVTGLGSDSDNDTGVGIWLGGGVYFTLGEHFNIGVEVKYSDADVTLFGESGPAGGTHYGLLAGYHW